jgi:hypothetical protein
MNVSFLTNTVPYFNNILSEINQCFEFCFCTTMYIYECMFETFLSVGKRNNIQLALIRSLILQAICNAVSVWWWA